MEKCRTKEMSRLSLPLAKALESQLTSEQSSTEDTGTHQKRYPTSKDKGEATMRW